MSARITEAGLRIAQRKVLVQLVRAPSLPVIFRDVDDFADLLFYLLQQSLSFGKFAGLEHRSDGRGEQGERKSRVLHGAILFGRGARLESRPSRSEVGGLFRRTSGGRRCEQSHAI